MIPVLGTRWGLPPKCCTLYTVQKAVTIDSCLRYTVGSEAKVLYTVHCVLYTVYCALYTVQEVVTIDSCLRYTVGSAAKVLYPAAGGSDDWAKGGAGIRYRKLEFLSFK